MLRFRNRPPLFISVPPNRKYFPSDPIIHDLSLLFGQNNVIFAHAKNT